MKLRATLPVVVALLSCRSSAPVTPPHTAATPVEAPRLSETPTATFARFAVAADHPEASRAGAEVLAAGGTAADAAAATMLALGVASPASSGLGGGGFALYYRASDRTLTFIDFRESAPAGLQPNAIQRFTPGGPPRPMGPTIGVPGEPRGIDELLHRFGRLDRARVVEPAARLAEQGFTPSEHMAAISGRFAEALGRDPLGRTFLNAEGTAMVAGSTVRNPALAATIRAFGREGADFFYQGAVADEIVRAAAGIGGVITADDLRAYRVVERQPLTADRFGFRWVTAPPESAGGFTMLSSLALMERWNPRSEPDVVHALAESWRGPFLDRARYFGDPDFVNVPIDALMAPERTAARAARFDMARARPSSDYDLPLPESPAPVAVPPGTGTSHLCVVDAEGNVASVTTTVNIPFGAGVSVRGFWLNDEMDDFTSPPAADAAGPQASTTNLAGARRRPVSTMTPSIVFEGDRPVLCVGGSGGTRIVTAVTQVAYRAMVMRTPVGEAVAHPRVHQAASPESMGVEADVPEAVQADLRARGHEVTPLRYGAVVQAVRIVREGDTVRLEAATDPRKGGRPAGR